MKRDTATSGMSAINRRTVLRVGATGATGLLVSACSGGFSGFGGSALLSSTEQPLGEQSTGSLAPLSVALLLPLSKDPQTAVIAQDLKQSAELALAEFARPGLTLVVKDTFGTPDGAAAAAREVLAAGVELIIGPLFSGEVAVVKAIAQPSRVPVVAFSTDRTVAGSGAYLLSFLAGAEIDRAIGYARQGGAQKFAALVPATPYGETVALAFQSAVAAHGGTPLMVERFPLEAVGMGSAVRRVGGKLDPTSGLLVAGGQDVLPTLASIFPYNGISAKRHRLIGTGAWNYAGVGQLAALNGAIIAAPDPSGWSAYSGRFAKAFGRNPTRIAGLAYDAINLAGALAGGPAGQRFSAESLTRASGFAGVDGLFRLKADGTCERGLAILEVGNGGVRVVEAAPSAFGPVAF